MRGRALVIAGPTAAGKTAAALAVARSRAGVRVLCADAMTVYRGLDIGTAKPTAAERAEVPHEGLDLVGPTEPFDVAGFLALADAVLAEPGPVVVVGGTGLYLHALRRGLVATPDPDPARRAALLADPDLFRRLQEVDPPLAERLDPADLVRVVRGVEVFEATGERLSALQAAHAAQPDRYHLVGLFLDRDDLDARIDARVHDMMARGYLEEVRGLLEAGVPRDAKPMRSLGYRHLADHLCDGVPLDEAVRRTQRDTRRFARKQRTWRNTLGWPRITADPEGAALAAAEVAFATGGDAPR